MIEVPGVFVRFEYYDEAADIYHVDYSEAYIVDEENGLILWNFIGDSLSAFLYQDFQRTDE